MELPHVSQSQGAGIKRVQTVERAFATLEHIAELGGTATLTELARGLTVSMAGTHRMLRTMVKLGYVHQLGDKSYCLGPGLIRLGEGAVEQHIIAAQPALARVAQRLGETATLAMLDGDTTVHVIQVQSSRSLRSTLNTKTGVPAHETGTGRVLLAELMDEQIRRALARAGVPGGGRRQRVMAAIRQIRYDGYSIDEGDWDLGLRSYAVPLSDIGRPFAISVAGSIDRLGNGDLNVIAVLRQAAIQIGGALQPASGNFRSNSASTD